MSRLPVKKTYKLYVGGAFPRSESGRTYLAEGQNVARASRKDLRDAVRAARAAQAGWAGATAYNRGQVLYRIAETMESRRADLATCCSGVQEVDTSIDRMVWYAGWADKLAQVLGGTTPVGSGIEKSKYGPATGLLEPAIWASLSAQPAYQTSRSTLASTVFWARRAVIPSPRDTSRTNCSRRPSSISATRYSTCPRL